LNDHQIIVAVADWRVDVVGDLPGVLLLRPDADEE